MKGKKRGIKERFRYESALINRSLGKYFEKLDWPATLCKAMKYAVFSGGKRLRAILVLESSRALGGNMKKALPFACSVELIHNFSLVHDDLPSMDNDDIRRGKPTCHRKFGEATAILAGDALLNLAFGIIASEKHGKMREILSVISEATGIKGMIGGQALDLKYEKQKKKNPGLRRKIDGMKTAALMAASCEIGALVSGGSPAERKRMYAFGMNLGLVFQIADDIEDSKYGISDLKRMRKKTEALISAGSRLLKNLGKSSESLLYIAENTLSRAKTPKIRNK